MHPRLTFVISLALVACSAGAQDLKHDVDAARSDFPDFLSEKAQITHAIGNKREFRKAIPLKISLVRSDSGPVLDASVSHKLAMEWGEGVEVQAVICDDETNALVERSISDFLTSNQFRTGVWDARGYLKAERQKYGVLFTAPPPPLYESFHLLVKLDARPKDLVEYIRLMYDVEAGPRPRRDPPPDRDWSNMTDANVVKEYVDLVLNKEIKDRALNTIVEHCAKVRSTTARTQEAAFQDIKRHISNDQAARVERILEKENQ